MSAKQTKIGFEQAYAELEKIAEEFEKGDVDLEEGLKKFERGMELAKFCKEHLEKVQNKVVEIKGRFKDLFSDETA